MSGVSSEKRHMGETAVKPWLGCRPTGRLLRPAEVFERTGLSRSQTYAMIARGEFPPFLKLSPRTSAMPQAWLDCFIEYRAEMQLGRLG